MQADFLINLGQKSQVQIISFSATTSSLSSACNQNFVCTTDNDSSKARLFIVHMLISLGSKLFATAKEIDMMSEGFVWIVTDAMANQLNLMDVSVIESMEGVIGVKPYAPKSNKVEDFIQRWKMKFREENSRIVDV
ncbi:hypothetical protein H5410_004136 [Solanum commersonii]|uniref:Receptor ligand binding region domain-containing protein n=1 Tax=Solanum commersonii TaxID=4109 RepID=A0A9J6B737_SOLCO|nr:hypothetical protein H5410_004136 [Solanum commersonii]